MPWRGPCYPGELPTLGWYVLDWMSANLAAPDRTEYEPFVPTREQAAFVLRYYAINPATGKRLRRRGVYSRPKGSGKSPFLGGLGATEALADVVPDGWDAAGEPVGRPWSSLRTPWVQFAAVSEDQTRNAWSPLLEMLREGPALWNYPGMDPMDTFVALPKGRIEFVTSAATSREGNRPVFAVLDQTEEWKPGNGGVRLAATIRRNLGKTGGSSIEAPNAYVPGAGSVAEDSAEYARRLAEAVRKGRSPEPGLLYDHREAPPETDMTDRESLMAGLRYAYGDSADSAGGWVDLERIAAEVWDPATDPQDARRFYLNQVTHATDSWLTQPEWAAVTDAAKVVGEREPITLGFDGSRSRAGRSTTDATALVGCRVSDGHLFLLEVWEQPDGPAGRDWRVPTHLVDLAVRDAFRRHRVVGMYADPAKWESYVAQWEADFGPKLRVKATRANPIEWWMTGGRARATVQALAAFHSAVVESAAVASEDPDRRELTHDGSSVLARHVLNARRRQSTQGVQIAKEHPDSPRKIDAAVAAVLAWQARLDALAAGPEEPPLVQYVPRRIR